MVGSLVGLWGGVARREPGGEEMVSMAGPLRAALQKRWGCWGSQGEGVTRRGERGKGRDVCSGKAECGQGGSHCVGRKGGKEDSEPGARSP